MMHLAGLVACRVVLLNSTLGGTIKVLLGFVWVTWEASGSG